MRFAKDPLARLPAAVMCVVLLGGGCVRFVTPAVSSVTQLPDAAVEPLTVDQLALLGNHPDGGSNLLGAGPGEAIAV